MAGLKLVNTTAQRVEVADVGIGIEASVSETFLDISTVRALAASLNLRTLLTAGTLKINDGSLDVPVADVGGYLDGMYVTGGGDDVIKAQSFGPTDIQRQYFSIGNGDSVYIAQPNAVNIFDMAIGAGEVGADSKCQLSGGEYWTNGNTQEGDYIEFSVVDKNDVLGYFALFGLTVGVDVFELAKYVKKRPVVNNEHGSIRPGQAATLYQGLFLRTIYVATAAGAERHLRISYDLSK